MERIFAGIESVIIVAAKIPEVISAPVKAIMTCRYATRTAEDAT
jgi:hypothetical protein